MPPDVQMCTHTYRAASHPSSLHLVLSIPRTKATNYLLRTHSLCSYNMQAIGVPQMQNTGRFTAVVGSVCACVWGGGGFLKCITQLATTHVHISDICKLSS